MERLAITEAIDHDMIQAPAIPDHRIFQAMCWEAGDAWINTAPLKLVRTQDAVCTASLISRSPPPQSSRGRLAHTNCRGPDAGAGWRRAAAPHCAGARTHAPRGECRACAHGHGSPAI